MPNKEQKTPRQAVDAMAVRLTKESKISYEKARAIAVRAANRHERDNRL